MENIKEISSINNPLIKNISNLKLNKYIKKEKKFIIEGDHLIDMADNILYLFSNDLNLLNKYNAKEKYLVNDNILKKLSSLESFPKIIAVVDTFLNNLNKLSKRLIYLDNIQDPGNLGSILRTALAFNFKDILISNDSSNIYSSKVINASEGSIFKLNLNINLDILTLIKLKKEGYTLISTSLNKDSIYLSNFLETKKLDRYILIFGNEGNGIRKEILEISDYKIIIPISNIDSLNVAVASSIIMYNFNNYEKD